MYISASYGFSCNMIPPYTYHISVSLPSSLHLYLLFGRKQAFKIPCVFEGDSKMFIVKL